MAEDEALHDRMVKQLERVVAAGETEIWNVLKGVMLSQAREKLRLASTDPQECVAAVAACSFVEELIGYVDQATDQLGVMEDTRYSEPDKRPWYDDERVDEIDAAGLIDPTLLKEEADASQE